MEKFDENHPWNAFVNSYARETHKIRKLKVGEELAYSFADGKTILLKRVK